MIITIDGYAGTGKSTAARMLAANLAFELMNTGAMYRATSIALRRAGIDIDAKPRDIEAIKRLVADYHFELTSTIVRLRHFNIIKVDSADEDIYTEAIGRDASLVGKFPEVRLRLQAEQRRIALGRDIICEGRDQGTTVFPDAPVKFYFKTSSLIRAQRRAAQEGIDPIRHVEAFKALVDQIEARDKQDVEREIDPLIKPEGAEVIDTSEMSPDQVMIRMMEVVERCRSNR